MYDLKKLKENRDEILKAELAAWLHDVGKLHFGHQSKYLRDKRPSNYIHNRFGPGPSKRFLETFSRTIPESNLLSVSITPEQIIRDHHRRIRGNSNSPNPIICLVQRMDWLDAEYDRTDIITFGSRAQKSLVQPTSSGFGLFSVFGFERNLYKWSKDIEITRMHQANCNKEQIDILLRLLCLLQERLPSFKFEVSYAERNKNLTLIRVLFTKAAGDTRHSVNDISLWEHSHSVSLLFKAFVSWCIANNLTWNSTLEDDVTIREKIQIHSEFQKWFHPQLLPLRIDGLRYLSASNNIPDLLGRRELLTKIYDELQNILEWEFPLAGEVYRDENGPVFLTFLQDKEKMINISQLILPESDSNDHVVKQAYLKALQNGKKSLEEYIRQAVIELSKGDLTLPPEISLVTYTQKRTGKKGEKSLGDILADERKEGLWLQADVSVIQNAWKDSAKENVCSVCGLRPLGFGATDEKERKKAISRKMCGVCLKRRADRAKSWAQGIEKSSEERFQNDHSDTVWLDEVADANGRLAFIVGYFPLEHWLDGTLVRSLGMFKRDTAQNEPVNHQISVLYDQGKSVRVVLGPKPVSYSRIRRIWETTRRFWQDVAPTDAPPEELQKFCQQNNLDLQDLWEGPLSLEKSLAGEKIGGKRSRLFLKVQNAAELAKDLGPFHAYELKVKNRKVAILWVPPDATDDEGKELKYRGGFWVIENLDYLKKQFEQDFRELIQENKFYEVYEPTEYGSPGSFKAGLQIEEILPYPNDKEEQEKISYTPLIPILAEPRTFMAIVPADKVFDIVKAIKAKYEREMGRVRNRLPLHIGIVFAYRKMPLRAIMDAGRRMLEQRAIGDVDKWKVSENVVKHTGMLPNEASDLARDTQQFKEWYAVELEHEETKRSITWCVPAVMGDGETDDYWYPYVFWQRDKDGKTDPGSATQPRIFYYQAPNPFNLDQNGKPQQCWLVHAGELQPGDKIYFTPATFDFEFLDFNARRFEIAYDEDGKRKNSLAKPYLLDEIRILEQIWEFITGKDKPNGKPRLSTTQMFALREMIETKREEWFDKPEDSLSDLNFRTFCNDLFINAEWQWGKLDDKKLKWLTEMAVQGYFTDAIYLFHHIMKQDIEVGKND